MSATIEKTQTLLKIESIQPKPIKIAKQKLQQKKDIESKIHNKLLQKNVSLSEKYMLNTFQKISFIS